MFDRFDPGLAFWRSFLDTLRCVVFDSLVATVPLSGFVNLKRQERSD